MVRVESINKIMNVFLDNLDKAFTIRGLSKKAELSYDTTYRHVEYLLKNEILTEKKVGKARLCRLDLESRDARKLIEEASLRRTELLFTDNSNLGNLFMGIIKKLETIMSNQILSIVSYNIGRTNIELLFLVSDVKVKSTVEKICINEGSKYGKKIAALITNISEFEKILETKKQASNEEIVYGTVLYGYEDYYNLLFRCLR